MADTRPLPPHSSKKATQPASSNTSSIASPSSARAVEDEKQGGALMFNGPLRFLRFPCELQLDILTPIIDRAIELAALQDPEMKRWTFTSFSSVLAHQQTIRTLNPLSYDRSIRDTILKLWFERTTFTSDVVHRVATITDSARNTQISRKTKIMDSLVRSSRFTANGQHVVLLTTALIVQLPLVLRYITFFAKACVSLKTMVLKVEVAGARTVKALNRLSILGMFHLWLAGYRAFVARSGLGKVEISLVLP
ncbi:hypothetical protein B0A48_17312 [Cryoendolithus antarcticus]|uniref:Uncharacterized protein n=1 Tax=Cryoendolithus antarcticus TaxID=1507870 RepID=A0A1V8SC13_9PEZI|nr:hypothetical protein B0A48_17312 [Cryoendolithus antarcticus]